VREQERQAARAKEEKLLVALMAARAAVADRIGVKAYQVCDEPQLRALVRARPSTLEAFRKAGLEGWGEAKVQNHGPAFVEAIVANCKELGLETDVTQLRPFMASGSGSGSGGSPHAVAAREIKWTDALAQTYAAFTQEKRSVHAIATERPKPIKEATVRSYLSQAAQTGREVDWDRLAFPGGLLPAVQRAMEHLLTAQQATRAEEGPAGPAALQTRDIQRVVPDYWQGQEAQWGDVEAARVCLLLRHWQVRFAPSAGAGYSSSGGGSSGSSGDMRSPAVAAAGGMAVAAGGAKPWSSSSSSHNNTPVGAWLSTRKRASPGGALAPAAAGGAAVKVHQPAYLSRSNAGPSSSASASATAPKIHIPSYAAATLPSTSKIISPPPLPAPAAAAATPAAQKQAASAPQAVVAALGASPQGLTEAELEARLGPVGPCLAALQEEGVVYRSGQGRFLLL
jgi:hypothetical protein